MKFQKSSSALGVLVTSISLGDVSSVIFNDSLIPKLAEVSDREQISIAGETEAEVVASATQTVLPQPSNRWDEASKKEFLDLAKKQALEVISPKEALRFQALKDIRRRDNPTRTFAQIKSDIEFHRSVESAIVAIQRLMNHDTEHNFTSA